MKPRQFGTWLLALNLVLGVALSLTLQAAQVDYFLEIPGVDGESTEAGHEGEIGVLSWSWGMSSPVDRTSGGATRAQFNDLVITKRLDKSSPLLMAYCAEGKHLTGADIVLTARRAGQDPQDYFKIIMTDVVVSAYQSGASSGDTPMDTVALNFATVKFSYAPQKPDGSLDTAIEEGWNVVENRKL